MHASSSIFLVIIALWAAYLVPGAIKRRRRTASARIADRDSVALRVVVRRPGSAAVVAAPAALEPSSRPVLGAGATPALPAAPRSPAPGLSRPAASRSAADVVRRRRRLVLLLLALSVAGAAAGALGVLPVLIGLLPSVGLLLVLAALARNGAARTATPVVLAHPAPAVRTPSAATPVPAPVAAAEGTTVLPAPREPAAAVPVTVPDGSWDPVAVPLPTYLLKPKAPERPQPVPAPPPPPLPVPTAAGHVDETPTVLIDLREAARVVNE